VAKTLAGPLVDEKARKDSVVIDDNRASGTKEEGKEEVEERRMPARDEKMGPHVAYAEARKELEDGHVVANEKRGEAG